MQTTNKKAHLQSSKTLMPNTVTFAHNISSIIHQKYHTTLSICYNSNVSRAQSLAVVSHNFGCSIFLKTEENTNVTYSNLAFNQLALTTLWSTADHKSYKGVLGFGAV